MADVFETLRQTALERTADFGDDDFIIRGLWKVDLAFKPNTDERMFRYAFLVSQTVGQGSCYCDTELVIDESLIGRDAREILPEKRCYSISVLDSIYASIPRKPQKTYELRGNSIEKTARRNAIIIDEVGRLLEAMGSPPGSIRVLNVGVLGTLIKGLKAKGYSVLATDLDDGIIDQSVHGVTVEHGSKTFQRIKECDLAVITGMTLTTDSLEDILEIANKHDTRLIMFAETGANFGEEYCRTMGIDIVVSEPFPFYIFQGTSTIEIYRRDAV
jgi:hypothetical protein